MTRAFFGAALAVALLGSVSAYAAGTPAAGGTTTPAPAATTTDTPPTPPASLHCKAPKVPTQVTGKTGKMTWKCQKPAATPPATPQ
jgi:hypothetical protein